MKHLMIILGLLLVGTTTYGQITISNDSIFDNANFLGRYTVQRVATTEGERVFVNFTIDKSLDADQKNQMENTIQLKLNTESETKGMRFYFFNYSVPSEDIKKNIFTISNDSILYYLEYIGHCTSIRQDGKTLIVNITLISKLFRSEKRELEKIIEASLAEQNRFSGYRWYYFNYSHSKQIAINAPIVDQTVRSGISIENAGKSYNGAAVISIIGSAGGTALVLTGYPIVGSVITMGSGLIAIILQIRGNNKLIKGGKALQRQRDVK